jgi:capsular exopolysaccharide synthesis family protein
VQTKNPSDNGIDLQKFAGIVLANWYYIVLSVLIALSIAFIVNRYTVPMYEVHSAVMINKPVEEGANATAILYGAEVFQGSKGLTDESIVLKTKALAYKTLKKLNFGVSYFQRGNVKLTEVYYPLSPINVIVDSSSANIPKWILFSVRVDNDGLYRVEADNPHWNQFFANKKFRSGFKYNIQGFIFTIHTNSEAFIIDDELLFQVNDLNALAGHYAGSLQVHPYGNGASALSLKLAGPTPAKDIDFLNAHMETYKENNLIIKNTNAINTLNFIDEQLLQISDSLYYIENRLESLKKNNSNKGISPQGNNVASELKGFEERRTSLLINRKYYDYLRNYLKKDYMQEQVLIPANLGISDPILNQLISQLVSFQAEISLIEKNPNQENPLVKNELRVKRQQLIELKNNILESLRNIEAVNNINLNELDSRVAKTSLSLQRLPAAERQLINIERIYNLSEKLYVFLMEKRAEAGILKAASTSDVTILSEAWSSQQMEPNESKNYSLAFLLGLGIPLAFMFVKDFFNNKISTLEDLKKLTTLPLLGVVGHNRNEETNLINQNSKSALSEAFRTVRSNIRFMTPDKIGGKIFVITSSISGEGKTFSAKNLAYILAISGERTILINADMRKPNNNKDLGVESDNGLSNYLAGYTSVEEVIHNTLQENLFILPSGDIPPNPSELLLSKRLEILMEDLKNQYDYIIIDTPPIGIISDGLELMQLADANIFMVRQDYTLKSFLINIQERYDTGKINHIAILFNDVDQRKLHYGYGYGYGYSYGYGYYAEDNEKKPWWKKLGV